MLENSKKRSFKVSIVLVVCTLLIITVLSIIAFTYKQSRSSILESVALNFNQGSQAVIDKLNEEWEKSSKPLFRTRIGLHTGYCIVGNIGSEKRMNYSVIGDNVNLASRLEGVNKNYRTKIIISRDTYRYVQNHFVCRILDQISVTGKSESTKIYELMAKKGSEEALGYEELAKSFGEAYELYLNQEWEDALVSL